MNTTIVMATIAMIVSVTSYVAGVRATQLIDMLITILT